METKDICPCPNLDCPNHGDCAQCTSRHVRKGYLNYCSFHTLLPTIKQVIAADPKSQIAAKLEGLIGAQLQAYEKLKEQYGLSQENQNRLLKEVAEYSEH